MPALSQASAAPDRDRLVALACGLGLVGVTLLLALDYRAASRPRSDAPQLARLASAEGRVMRRPAGTLAWEPAGAGDGLQAHDSVYVPPQASASIEFAAGSTLEVEERTLVVIDPPEPERHGTSLALVKGALSGSAGTAPLSVRAAGGQVAVLEPGASARLGTGPGGARLDVLSGRAQLDDASVAAPSLVRLDSPARNQRIWASRFPVAVALTWDGAAAAGLALEAARDAGFTRRLASAPAEPGRLDLQIPEPGPWFWRLAGPG
ncbi:MAG TPA: hypothetical protein VFI16_09995, partial [Anaeromyxobacteraceae bacterium]|nr:hypothetical protein [Anaeromyxobacteraceae bacterium]